MARLIACCVKSRQLHKKQVLLGKNIMSNHSNKISDDGVDKKLNDKELQHDNIDDALKMCATSLIVLTGATLIAVFGFTGSVWSNPSKEILNVCAKAIRDFSGCFLFSVISYMGYIGHHLSASRSQFEILKKTRTDRLWAFISFLFMIVAFFLYISRGSDFVSLLAKTIENEALLHTGPGTIKPEAVGSPSETTP
jgi:hypothetical protein